MNEVPTNYLRHLHMRLGEVAFRLTKLNISSLPSLPDWCPPVNAFACDDELVICVDLAGVDRSEIDLRVESQRIILRGRRRPLEPSGLPGRAMRILALEIDHGPFEREIALPVAVNPEAVRAEHRRGVLWIYLPVTARE